MILFRLRNQTSSKGQYTYSLSHENNVQCAQIGPKYSNLSAQMHSETDFLIPHDSVAIRVSRETTD